MARRLTLSTGAQSEETLSDLSDLRPNSAASVRVLTRSAGCESRARRDSLRSIVVTPDRIPQFTIPKLAVEEDYKCCAKDRGIQPGQDTAWELTQHRRDPVHLSSSVSTSSSSSSSLFSSSPVLGRKAQRSISDPADKLRHTSVRGSSCTFMESDQCCDPATRGALSLPHLAKITTPYGFITLSQSPQMANEEELFLQKDYRSWTRDKKSMPLRKLSVEMRNNGSGRTLGVQNHTEAGGLQVSRGTNRSETSICSGSFASPDTASRRKQSFWGILRKHISKQKSI